MRPEDDYTHPVGPEPNFNESMYFHFHDPEARLGGFVRMANRPNEGRGEVTVCLFLPDGSLGFFFARPEVTSNEAFEGAGMAFRVREPFRHIDISYSGPISVVADPAAMDDPKLALGGSPRVDCTVELAIRGMAPAFDHSFDTEEGSFAPNHYEQLLSAEGRVVVDGTETALRGFGLRDHSWGPRYWQTPWFYRWVHGATDGFGFMGAWFGRPDGSSIRGGFVWDGETLHEVDGLDIVTERDDRDEQAGIAVVLRCARREWKVQGRALATVPLRNRRDDGSGTLSVTRIVESLMVWTLHDGRTLHGMSEYLDQILHGRPVGLEV
ncbi:hypothetical protein ACFQE5_12340 [Pseudonocardia hispaniensis]|uniref:Tocopherol cyclase-like protein n=1 Tax=Pseudonocardia hispaniensis TaxID=904933 RepID=A0ABW1J3S8_9PSEU